MKRLLLLGLWAACTMVWATPEATAESEETTADPAAAAEPAPVTGAFGVPLGEPFEPCRVAEVLDEHPKSFTDRDGNVHEGSEFQVRPRVPNPHFDRYSVLTNEHGVVYSVQASFEDPQKKTRCEATRKLASLLEEKYGQPRGRSPAGDWYAFRDTRVDHYRGIRLTSNRCRRGLYSIEFTDDGAMDLVPKPPIEPTDSTGL